jgi:RNA polymerase sigma-70 factor (ECF subfamily)
MQPLSHATVAPGIGLAVGSQASHSERFEHAFRTHSRSVLGYALRRVDQPEDAADVVSEVMLVAWRRVGDLPSDEGARLWLYGIARRVLANQTRSRNRRVRLGERLRDDLSRVPLGAEAPGLDERTRDSLHAALRELPESDRELLLLSSWEDLEPAEIAVVIGVAPATVRTRLHRARRRLRDLLEEQS